MYSAQTAAYYIEYQVIFCCEEKRLSLGLQQETSVKPCASIINKNKVLQRTKCNEFVQIMNQGTQAQCRSCRSLAKASAEGV